MLRWQCLGTLNSQGTGNLLFFLCTDVTTSLFKIIILVSKNSNRLISIVNLILGWQLLSFLNSRSSSSSFYDLLYRQRTFNKKMGFLGIMMLLSILTIHISDNVTGIGLPHVDPSVCLKNFEFS